MPDAPAAAASTQRCSVLSAQRGEPMSGTAFAQRGLLLVEQPGPWGHRGLAASHFDGQVAAALQQRADQADLRLLAIRRPGRTAPDAVRHWAVVPSPGRAPRWSTFGRAAELLDVALDGSAGVADEQPAYLVCAHSKRDLCCALRGRALAAALAQLRPGRVWECSHTGGHRFAPIVLALPIGALYGRVPLAGLDDIVVASERGEVLPQLLRGLVGYSPVEQAVIAHALDTLGLAAPGDVQVVDAAETVGGRWSVSVAVRGEVFRATVTAERVLTPMPSCGKQEPKQEVEIRVTAWLRR